MADPLALLRRLLLGRLLLGRLGPGRPAGGASDADADPASGGPVLLIAGLGNPGSKYEKTRHNIGFMALDEIVRRQSLGGFRSRFQSAAAEGPIGTEKVLALKPQTYMNNAGQAVGEAARFFKLGPERVIVLYDELDLAPGKVRVRTGGGAAGHNGIRSVIQHLGADFTRVRIGIGHPGDKTQVTPYVLGEFSKAEAQDQARVCEAIGEEIPRLIAGDAEGFMSRVAWRAQVEGGASG